MAVEPSEGMRVGFEKGLERSGLGRDEQGRVGGEGGVEVEIVDGTFEEIPVGEGEADLVRCLGAFLFLLQPDALPAGQLIVALGRHTHRSSSPR